MHLHYLSFIIAFQYCYLNINADELVQVNLVGVQKLLPLKLVPF